MAGSCDVSAVVVGGIPDAAMIANNAHATGVETAVKGHERGGYESIVGDDVREGPCLKAQVVAMINLMKKIHLLQYQNEECLSSCSRLKSQRRDLQIY